MFTVHCIIRCRIFLAHSQEKILLCCLKNLLVNSFSYGKHEVQEPDGHRPLCKISDNNRKHNIVYRQVNTSIVNIEFIVNNVNTVMFLFIQILNY